MVTSTTALLSRLPLVRKGFPAHYTSQNSVEQRRHIMSCTVQRFARLRCLTYDKSDGVQYRLWYSPSIHCSWAEVVSKEPQALPL